MLRNNWTGMSENVTWFSGKTKLFWWKQLYCEGEYVLTAIAELDEDSLILL